MRIPFFYTIYKKLVNPSDDKLVEEINFYRPRVKFIVVLFVLAFSVIITRLVWLSISGYFDQRTYYSTETELQNLKRANIVDRNGNLLATDINTASLYANLVLVDDPKEVTKKIIKVLPYIDYDRIYKKLSAKNNSREVLITKNLTPKQQKKIQDLGIAGLFFKDCETRIYPQGSLFAHVIGYTDIDRNGISGLEKEHDNFLKNNVADLKLSLDIRVQNALWVELTKGMKKFNAKAMMGIIMDANNGEILGMVSLPDFDPNRQFDATDDQKFNRATYGVYELGSVLKIFTVAMALDNSIVTVNDKYNVKEPIKYGRFTITDTHPKKEIMTVTEILAESSNIGTVKIAQEVGIKKQKEFLKKIGLLDRVNSNFPSLGQPLYPSKWRDINLITISYGHGIAVTPLHVVVGTAAMVNGGVLHNPTFLLANNNGEELEGIRVIREETSKTVRELLQKVVDKGTGSRVRNTGFMPGGKTGTAEKLTNGSYNKDEALTSFISAFPMDNPRFIVMISVDEPHHPDGSKLNTGGMTAAPIASNVIKRIAPMFEIEPR